VTELALLTWNLELGARAGEAAIEGLRDIDVDVIVLQELGPEHEAALMADQDLHERFPYRELVPLPGVEGMGLLSAHPIVRRELRTDPMAIEAVLDVDGQPVTVFNGHPLPGRIGMAGPLPVSFDPSSRDQALHRFRALVDAAIGRGETVIVAGDFNTAPTEPAFERLVAGLADAHAEIGLGPGWTWRPSRLEGFGLGFLRIDLALSGPGARPVAITERCHLPGDHCQLGARFALD
jgi:vancomycin resistance protein VanJ